MIRQFDFAWADNGMDGRGWDLPTVADRASANGIGRLTMIRMKGRDSQISFDAVIERIATEVPRFIVYPGKAWDETGTFTVEVSLNGIPIGLRNLIPWKERGWHFGLSEPMCRKVGVETGDRVYVEMRRLGDTRPQELDELLNSDPKAQRAWNGLSGGERRDFVISSRMPRNRRRAYVVPDGFSVVDATYHHTS